MRSWIGTGIVAAVGGAIAAAALVGTGVVGNRNSSDASSSPGERGMSPQAIYERAAPGVVHVSATTTRDPATPFFVGASRGSGNEMTGSGFVLSDDGLIVTNAHLIAGATALRVTFSDRSSADARLLGSDPDTDLALLQVDTDGHDLRPLELGDSHTVHVGDPTVAVGSADAQSRTLTTGHVSATRRRITAASGFGIDDVIQTDGVLNSGNAGGPLLDARSGDRITDLDGRAVASMDDVAAILARHTPGDVVGLVVERGGGPEQSLEATLEDRPATVPVE